MSPPPLRSETPPHARELQCPSAQPEMAGATAFGIIDHSDEIPLLDYLDQPTPASQELLDLARPLRPTQIFRFAAPCQGDRCGHWSGAACTLVDRITELLPVVSLTLPPCRIRSDCRWFAQRGRNACVRCPQVVTQNEQPTEQMIVAATPPGK